MIYSSMVLLLNDVDPNFRHQANKQAWLKRRWIPEGAISDWRDRQFKTYSSVLAFNDNRQTSENSVCHACFNPNFWGGKNSKGQPPGVTHVWAYHRLSDGNFFLQSILRTPFFMKFIQGCSKSLICRKWSYAEYTSATFGRVCLSLKVVCFGSASSRHNFKCYRLNNLLLVLLLYQ